jgi:DNA polymerase-3 subunit delta
MTPAELARELAKGRLRSAYLLAGEEPLLRDDALRAIREAALEGSPEDFDLQRLRGESASAGELRDALATLPVLARRRLVVLVEPAATRARSSPLCDALADLVPELATRDDLVLAVLAARADKRARWVKAFAEPGALVDCDPPRGARAVASFVRDEARRQGIALGDGAAELLAERVGPQLLVIRRELEKAALLAGPEERVTRAHVAAGTALVAEQPIWDLTDAIGEGRAPDALQLLGRLQGAGAPAPVILGSLASHFRRLARARCGEKLAGPPFVLRKLERQSRRYTPERLVSCLEAIHRTDAALKGAGSLPPDLALERLVLGLAA